MTVSDPITELLSAANPVPTVAFLVPTVDDANEFLAIVKGLDLTDGVGPRTGLSKVGVGSEASHAPRRGDTDERLGDDPMLDYLQAPGDIVAPLRSRRRGRAVAAVAATILVVVGLVVVAEGNDGDVVTDPASTPSVTDPVSPTREADFVPSPSVIDPLGYQWSRVSHVEAVFGGEYRQRMTSVTVGGPGLVAVGFDQALSTESGRGSAMVWTSVDGVTWSRVPYDESVFGEAGDQWMTSVTVGGPGLVAVGESDRDAAVWTSVDGITWSRVPYDESVFGGAGRQAMNGVTVGGPGLVAVGESDAYAAVWTSADGVTWSRVPHDAVVFAGDRMSSVTVGGHGLVAVGSRGNFLDAAVWTSRDGLAWSRVPHDESVFGAVTEPGGNSATSMDSVTVGGPGLVAVGIDGRDATFDAAVWNATPAD